MKSADNFFDKHRNPVGLGRRARFRKEDHRQNIGVEHVPPDKLHVHDFGDCPSPAGGKECSQIG